MEKDRKVSLRLSGVRVDFAKAKLGVKRDGELLMLLVDMYYDYYNPIDRSFIVGVPKNEISNKKDNENKGKIQSEQGKPKDKADIFVSGDKEDGGEFGIVTQIRNGRPVKGRYDENGLFKRL